MQAQPDPHRAVVLLRHHAVLRDEGRRTSRPQDGRVGVPCDVDCSHDLSDERRLPEVLLLALMPGLVAVIVIVTVIAIFIYVRSSL